MDDNTYEYLTLSGGGTIGYTYIGCLRYIEEKGLVKKLKQIAGTSIGAIMALFINLGSTSNELEELFKGVKLKEYIDINIDKISEYYGLESGYKIIEMIKTFIKKKVGNADITFNELYNLSEVKLIIVGTCVNTKSPIYFNYKTTPNVRVCDAIRISIGFPLLFTVVKYNGELYCDGGLTDNFPIHLFKKKNSKKILGLKIVTHDKLMIGDLISYITTLPYCSIYQCEQLRNKECIGRIVEIDTCDITNQVIELDISSETIDKLIKRGYDIMADCGK